MEQLKRLNPITLFCYFFAVVFLTMFLTNPCFLAVSFVFSVLFSTFLKRKFELKPFIFAVLTIIFFTIVNVFFSHNGLTVLFFLNGNPITLESVISGLNGGLLITSSVYWFSSLNELLTSDEIISLFNWVSPSFALLISMTLRYLPLMKKRYDEISDCQRLLFPEKKKLRSCFERLSILITWSLEKGVMTADSMNARGYFLKNKSRLSFYPYRKIDFFAEAIVLALLSLCLIFGGGYSVYPVFSGLEVNFIALFSEILLMLLPIFFIVKEVVLCRKFQSET